MVKIKTFIKLVALQIIGYGVFAVAKKGD